jgi:hypothetical protein
VNPARVRRELDAVTRRIQAVEARLREIETLFSQPDYFARNAAAEVRAREAERQQLEADLVSLMAEWERLETLGAGGAD